MTSWLLFFIDLNLLYFLTTADNGFNPVWNEAVDFDLINPDLALIRFVILDEDVFADSNFLGQCTLPVKCLKSG